MKKEKILIEKDNVDHEEIIIRNLVEGSRGALGKGTGRGENLLGPENTIFTFCLNLFMKVEAVLEINTTC